MSLWSAENDKINIKIITGGHGFERPEFFQVFDSYAGIEYQELVQPAANDIYASQAMQAVDVLVFYDMVQEISDSQKKALLALLKQGQGMVFLHHSLASYQEWHEFINIIGGRYYDKKPENKWPKQRLSSYKHDVMVPVKVVDHDHPVLNGIGDFTIHDEVYGNTEVLKTVHPLLTTTHPESATTIAWTHRYLNSSIVYIQLGHDHKAYEDKNFRKLVKQAIEWVSSKR
jgi:type 1 glutamine amidotransferase